MTALEETAREVSVSVSQPQCCVGMKVRDAWPWRAPGDRMAGTKHDHGAGGWGGASHLFLDACGICLELPVLRQRHRARRQCAH